MVIIILFIYIYTYTCPPYGSLSVLFFISLDQNRITSCGDIRSSVFDKSQRIENREANGFFNFD